VTTLNDWLIAIRAYESNLVKVVLVAAVYAVGFSAPIDQYHLPPPNQSPPPTTTYSTFVQK
jgi:hypothetical protein